MLSLLSKICIFLLGICLIQTNHCIAVPNAFEQISSYSQASQDRFVYTLLYELFDKQDEGYYFEIGAGHPISTNNSYFFEKNLGWKGISLDIDPKISMEWRFARKNLLLIEDATQSDYKSILQSSPHVIDYLSLDIDSSYDVVLQKIPFNEHVFKVITIEHDFYRHGEKYRKNEREILSSLGYYLLCPDVVIFFNGKDCIFEDWWIYPKAFPADLVSMLISLDLKTKKHDQLINILQSFIFHLTKS